MPNDAPMVLAEMASGAPRPNVQSAGDRAHEFGAGGIRGRIQGDNESVRSEEKQMNNMEYRAFLDLMMCCDPWPVATDSQAFDTHQQMLDVANRLATDRGYSDWIDAYHRHEA